LSTNRSNCAAFAGTQADIGKLPGAVITLNPYVAGARFVIAGGDLDRNVKDLAARIARQTAQYVSGSRQGVAFTQP